MLDATFQQAFPLARRAARVHAAAAVERRAVLQSEHEDLEQEGLIACWRALPQYDPDRASLRTFVERVVAARLTSLHRERCCRPRFQALEDDQCQVGGAWAQEIDLRSDVHRVLDTLAESDRRLALGLIENTPTEASKLVGIARSTVYRRLQVIRVAFADAGLRPRGASKP